MAAKAKRITATTVLSVEDEHQLIVIYSPPMRFHGAIDFECHTVSAVLPLQLVLRTHVLYCYYRTIIEICMKGNVRVPAYETYPKHKL